MAAASYKDAKYWMEQVDSALKHRKKVSCEHRWSQIESYYDNGDNNTQGQVKPYFNLIYMHGRSLLPTLMYDSPKVVNTPRRPEYTAWASYFDSIDSVLVHEMEVESVFKEAALFTYLYNACAVQTCYDFPQRNIKKVDVQKLFRNISSFPRVDGVINRARRTNLPWLDLIHPRKLILPKQARNQRTLRWFGKMLCYPLEDLKAQGGLQNLVATHVPENVGDRKALVDYFGLEDTDNNEYVVFYELHDACNQSWAWLSSTGEYILPWEPDPTQVDGLPIELLTFNPSPNNLWGTPDALYIESQMLEGNEIRAMAAKQRRVSLLKGLVDKGLIAKEELEKFYSNEALPFISVENLGTKNINEAVALIQPHIPPEWSMYAKDILNDSQLILGFGPNQLGNFAPGRRTKFEAQVVEDRNLVRTNERRNIIGNAIRDVMRKSNQLIIKNWDFPLVQRVIGVDAATYWVQAQPSQLQDLSMEITTDVDIESMAPMSAERKKAEVLEMMGILAQIPGAQLIPLVRQLAAAIPYVDVDKVLPPAPQTEPMGMEQFQQQQNQMMQDPNLGQTVQKNLRMYAGSGEKKK